MKINSLMRQPHALTPVNVLEPTISQLTTLSSKGIPSFMDLNVSHGTLRRPIVKRMVSTLEKIGAQILTRGVMSTRLVRLELRLCSLPIPNTKIHLLTLRSPARMLANVWERIIYPQSILESRVTLQITDQVANLGTR